MPLRSLCHQQHPCPTLPHLLSCKIFSLLFLTSFLLGVQADAEGNKTSTVLATAPAFYPRLATIMTGADPTHSFAAAVIEAPNASSRRLVLLKRTLVSSSQETWEPLTEIVSDPDPTADLSNGYLYQLEDGTILCAYRHHTGPPRRRVYRIAVSASTDGGNSFSLRSIVSAGPVGVWEPFIYTHSSNRTLLRLLFSAELINGGQQDIVQYDSTDAGHTWRLSARVHTANSRNGMPGATELPDRSLLIVFEGFWSGVWAHFTVNSMRSFDGGTTWSQPTIVYAPSVASGRNAGSPQIAFDPRTNRVCVVFMCDQNRTAGSRRAAGGWPDEAQVWMRGGELDAHSPQAPLVWDHQPVSLTTITPTAYWPSLFLDEEKDLMLSDSESLSRHGSERRNSEVPLLRVAYQTSDGRAALTDYSPLA
eukprot:m.6183 g.6183  ORF g.6183 m.6183 type:complete len:420 (-) comp4716_c0_seq1:56-1315(-)